jgi:hypothetical protein
MDELSERFSKVQIRDPTIMKGEVVYLYAFDVANEIVMERIREILSEKPFPFGIQVDRTFPKDIPLYRPLAIEPRPPVACLAGQPVKLLIRVYDVGVVTVTVRRPFEVDQLAELVRFHNPTLDNGQSLDQLALDLCQNVYKNLKDFLVQSTPPEAAEPYTVFCLTDLGSRSDVPGWLAGERRNVAGLLTESDPARLSESQVTEILRLQRSFETTDMVVIDWDAALVVDLTGYVEDVLYVLEMANLQQEEFRVMDRTLDRYLNRAYEDLDRRRVSLFGVTSPVLAKLRRFRVDLTKLADEVTHITKFLGDWYLALVYVTARERFHLDQWKTSVEGRLAQLDQLYSVVQTEINEKRMLWLEILIVVLFVLDIVALFIWKV